MLICTGGMIRLCCFPRSRTIVIKVDGRGMSLSRMRIPSSSALIRATSILVDAFLAVAQGLDAQSVGERGAEFGLFRLDAEEFLLDDAPVALAEPDEFFLRVGAAEQLIGDGPRQHGQEGRFAAGIFAREALAYLLEEDHLDDAEAFSENGDELRSGFGRFFGHMLLEQHLDGWM